MARTKKTEEIKKEEEKVGAEVIGVYSKTGQLVREYTVAQSDERARFDEKATEYAKKIGGTTRKIR